MSTSPPRPVPRPGPTELRQVWSVSTESRPRGLALAREKGWLLAWDDSGWLYLVDRAGKRQAQRLADGSVQAACCADDGSAYAVAGSRGEVCWLAPDLMPRWERPLPSPPLAAALDSFGQVLAVSDDRGHVYLFDRQGHLTAKGQTHRPLHHLAFVPEAPWLVGSADLGLVVCFDLACNCLWQDGLVAHIGDLAVNSDGSRIVFACFSDGLRRYGLQGQKHGGQLLPEPCRLASLSYDGRFTLVGGLNNRLLLVDSAGQLLVDASLDQPLVALRLSALGDTAAVALADRRIANLALSAPPR